MTGYIKIDCAELARDQEHVEQGMNVEIALKEVGWKEKAAILATIANGLSFDNAIIASLCLIEGFDASKNDKVAEKGGDQE